MDKDIRRTLHGNRPFKIKRLDVVARKKAVASDVQEGFRELPLQMWVSLAECEVVHESFLFSTGRTKGGQRMEAGLMIRKNDCT